jgi:hypothetical protein
MLNLEVQVLLGRQGAEPIAKGNAVSVAMRGRPAAYSAAASWTSPRCICRQLRLT